MDLKMIQPGYITWF